MNQKLKIVVFFKNVKKIDVIKIKIFGFKDY